MTGAFASSAAFGGIDILVDNVGMGAGGRFEDITDLSIFETLRASSTACAWSSPAAAST